MRLLWIAIACIGCGGSSKQTGASKFSPAKGGGETESTGESMMVQPGSPARPAPSGPTQGGPVDCPNIQVKGPDSISQGQKARIQVITDGVAPTVSWTITAGTIASGQGTRSIQVDTSGLAGASVTATVQIGGLPRECETTSGSLTVLVGP